MDWHHQPETTFFASFSAGGAETGTAEPHEVMGEVVLPGPLGIVIHMHRLSATMKRPR